MDRDDHSTSTSGTVTFLFFRLLWLALIFLGYYQNPELFMGLLRSLPFVGQYFSSSPDTNRLFYLGICCAVTSVRQIFWVLYLRGPKFGPLLATIIGIMIPFVHTAITAVGLAANAAPYGTAADTAGLLLFLAGAALSTGSELERKAFKSDPRNAGKLYTGGSFAVARHINFTGEILWGAALVLLSTNSWAGAAAFLAMQVGQFTSGTIPELSAHMDRKYRAQWAAYKARTPYVLIPGLV